jgi:hypothetical protein
MRITYEIGNGACTIVSVSPYARLVKSPPEWKGAKAEVEIFFGMDDDEEVEHNHIQFNGDLEDMREMLTETLDSLNAMAEFHAKQSQEEYIHSERCTHCGVYYDTRKPREWGHANGEGLVCMADGTILVHECDITNANGTSLEFKDIEIGDSFHINDESIQMILVAEESSRMHFDGNYSSLGIRAKISLKTKVGADTEAEEEDGPSQEYE